MKKLSRRGRVRVLSFNLAIIISLAILFGMSVYESNYYKMLQKYSYQQSVNELSEYVNNINVALSKGIYASTAPMVTELSVLLLKQSSGAKSALSQLPLNDLSLEGVYKFLSQIGEYAMSLSKRVNAGETLGDEEHDTLASLSDYASQIKAHTDKLAAELDTAALVDSQIKRAENPEGEIGIPTMSGFSEAEESLADFPSLIYDGPFSSHLTDKKPLLTENASAISPDEARQLASDFSGIDETELKDDGDENGNMPCYSFSDGETTINVTKSGGFIAYMISSRYCGEIKLSTEQARQKAAEALVERGIESMSESYYMIDDGICVVNFAFKSEDVTYYTDLIKIGICMDDGDVVFFDSRQYITNHTERELPEKSFTSDQAQSVLSKYLNVSSVKEAVIPSSGKNEVYCYEFLCSGKNNEELLVYINTQTCLEADILLLLYADNGVLTM